MLDVTNVTNPFPQESQLYFRVEERDIGWHNIKSGESVFIPEEKALVRAAAGGGRWLANVGRNYTVVRNSDLFPYVEEHFMKVLDPMYLQNVETIEHMAHGGRDCYREYRFNDLRCDIGDNVSDVAFRAIIGNSYGSKAVTLLSGAIDFFCTNGMIFGQADRKARKHTSGFHLQGIDKWISDSVEQYVSHGKRIVDYSNMPIDVGVADPLFEFLQEKGLLSDRMAAQMREQMHAEHEQRDHTSKHPSMWHLYSALTQWASHADVRNTGNDHEANTRINRTQHAERVIRAAEQYVRNDRELADAR